MSKNLDFGDFSIEPEKIPSPKPDRCDIPNFGIFSEVSTPTLSEGTRDFILLPGISHHFPSKKFRHKP